MSKYCKHCGVLIEEEKFCPNCGKQIGARDMNPPGIDKTPNQLTPRNIKAAGKQRSKKKKDTPVRRTVRIALLALIVLLAGTGVWIAGDLGGVWDKMSLNTASEAWKRQSDYKDEQKAILECLNLLADALESGDVENALQYIDADKKDYFRLLFGDNQSSLPSLVYALRASELSFLSETDVSYDSSRTATVFSELMPSSDSPEPPRMIIRLIKQNDSWVVTAL